MIVGSNEIPGYNPRFAGSRQLQQYQRAVEIYENAPVGQWQEAHKIVNWLLASNVPSDGQLFWLIPTIEKFSGHFFSGQQGQPVAQEDLVKARIILENAVKNCVDEHSRRDLCSRLGIMLSRGADHIPAEPARAKNLLEEGIRLYLTERKFLAPGDTLAVRAFQHLVDLYEKGAPGVSVNQVRANEIRAFAKKHYCSLT
jgi:hypothetical protein